MVFNFLRGRRGDEVVERLHACVNALARSPAQFRREGVADTPEGRFEMLALYMTVVVRRLRRAGLEGERRAQQLVDRMFDGIDGGLRELGVGDLSVPRKIKALAAGYLGRAKAYEGALDAGDLTSLAAAIDRNVFAGTGAAGGPQRLAARVHGLAEQLRPLDLAALEAGQWSEGMEEAQDVEKR